MADRFAAIGFAAEQILTMIELESAEELPIDAAGFARRVLVLARFVFPLLNRTTSSVAAAERDPELEQVLVRLDRDLTQVERLRGPERDEAREQVERWAAPYAVAFYEELRRLDELRIRGV